MLQLWCTCMVGTKKTTLIILSVLMLCLSIICLFEFDKNNGFAEHLGLQWLLVSALSLHTSCRKAHSPISATEEISAIDKSSPSKHWPMKLNQAHWPLWSVSAEGEKLRVNNCFMAKSSHTLVWEVWCNVSEQLLGQYLQRIKFGSAQLSVPLLRLQLHLLQLKQLYSYSAQSTLCIHAY